MEFTPGTSREIPRLRKTFASRGIRRWEIASRESRRDFGAREGVSGSGPVRTFRPRATRARHRSGTTLPGVAPPRRRRLHRSPAGEITRPGGGRRPRSPKRPGGPPRMSEYSLIVSTDPEQMTDVGDRFDVVIDTISSPCDLGPYLRLVDTDGVFSHLGHLGHLGPVTVETTDRPARGTRGARLRRQRRQAGDPPPCWASAPLTASSPTSKRSLGTGERGPRPPPAQRRPPPLRTRRSDLDRTAKARNRSRCRSGTAADEGEVCPHGPDGPRDRSRSRYPAGGSSRWSADVPGEDRAPWLPQGVAVRMIHN